MNIEETAKKIVWLGHDCFRIDGDKIVYFDPYQISPGTKADLILVTHEHFDHCSPGDIAKIQKPETVIVTEKDAAKKLEGNVKVVRPGQTIDVDEIKLRQCQHITQIKHFIQKKRMAGVHRGYGGCQDFTMQGDTDFIPEMNQFEVDIALLPVSGTYVMTAVDAMEAALAIRPKLAIPMHYGAIVGGGQDAKDFKIALEGKVEVLVL